MVMDRVSDAWDSLVCSPEAASEAGVPVACESAVKESEARDAGREEGGTEVPHPLRSIPVRSEMANIFLYFFM